MNRLELVIVLASSIAASGTVLQIFGWSPGRVSEREPYIDFMINHLLFFGPLVLGSWIFAPFVTRKLAVFTILLVNSLVFAAGLVLHG